MSGAPNLRLVGDDCIPVVFYEHKADPIPQRMEFTWGSLVKLFSTAVVGDKDGRAFSPVTIRTGGKRCNADTEYVHAWVGDIDGIKEPGAEEKRGLTDEERDAVLAKIAGFRAIVYSTWSSRPGAWRLRVIIPYDEPVRGSIAEAVHKMISRKFELPGEDGSVCDPARFHYTPRVAPGVEYWFHSQDGEPYRPLEAPLPTTSAAETQDPELDIVFGELRLVELEELPAALSERCLRVIARGDDNEKPFNDDSDALFFVCGQLVRAGCDNDFIRGVCRHPSYGISRHPLKEEKKAAGRADRAIKNCIKNLREAVAEEFQRHENGKLVKSQQNIALALRKFGVTVQHDLLIDRAMVAGLEDFGPRLDDAALRRLRMQCEEKFDLHVGKDFFADAVLDHARYHSHHPVKDYLAGLTWDGRPRIGSWLVEYGGADDSEYTRAVGRLVLLAAVRRIRSPGCKFDEMLILESPKQGTNKSTALKILAVRDEWFIDDYPFDQDTKRLMESTEGRWIVEAGELKGMRKAEVGKLKATLSRQIDSARLSYDRFNTDRPRQYVVIGTTNDTAGYLKDDTNRRFWPVRVKEFALDRLQADRDQLWSEAAQCEASGESIRLDPKLWSDAAVEQDDRRSEDHWVAHLHEQLGARDGKIRIVDCFRLLGVRPGGASQEQNNRLGSAMRELGWERKKRRHGEGPEWSYVKGDGERQLCIGGSDRRGWSVFDDVALAEAYSKEDD